ncbi:MAG: molybdopterin converting factor subunit 1 [Conexivisphaerales archaeon]
MPKIKVLYWAQAKEAVGKRSEIINLPDGLNVANAVDAIVKRHSELSRIKKQIRIAVNKEVVDDDHKIRDGDELALLPAVAGG